MIRHVLKDGTIIDDIQGHIVKKQDAITIYALLDIINRRKGTKNGEAGESHKGVARV